MATKFFLGALHLQAYCTIMLLFCQQNSLCYRNFFGGKRGGPALDVLNGYRVTRLGASVGPSFQQGILGVGSLLDTTYASTSSDRYAPRTKSSGHLVLGEPAILAERFKCRSK